MSHNALQLSSSTASGLASPANAKQMAQTNAPSNVVISVCQGVIKMVLYCVVDVAVVDAALCS